MRRLSDASVLARVALAGLMAGNGCGSSTGTEPTSLAVVSITPTSVTIAPGIHQPLAAKASYNNGHDTVVTAAAHWTSSDSTVVKVTAAGVATGVAVGSADVTASFGGLSGTSHVVVSGTPPTLLGTSVNSSSTSLAVGDQLTITVTGEYPGGATGNVTTQASWVSTNSGVASVSAGVVSGVSVGTAAIIATLGSFVDTVQVAVTPTNEPAGFTKLTEHFFNTVFNTDGAGVGVWSADSPGFSIVQDSTAPKSPPNVAQFTYPAGFQAGSAPGHIEFDLPPNISQLYISIYMKLSANFEGQQSETNKVGFAWILDHPAVFLSNQGAGSDSLYPTLRFQGPCCDTRAYFRQNVGTLQAMNRGQWRRWEVLLIANTPGQTNGVIRYWIDGQKVGDYTDVWIRDTAGTWQYVYLQPIWGGTAGQVAQTQYLWVDHLYVSGAP